jgi:hypothetical protein
MSQNRPTRKRSEGRLNGGYGKPVKRVFKLAPHHYLVPAPWSGKYVSDPGLEDRIFGFKLFRAPDGSLVARKHDDLRPGEVSLVLE